MKEIRVITNIKIGLATISGYHPDSSSTQLLIFGVNKDVDNLITDHKAVVEKMTKENKNLISEKDVLQIIIDEKTKEYDVQLEMNMTMQKAIDYQETVIKEQIKEHFKQSDKKDFTHAYKARSKYQAKVIIEMQKRIDELEKQIVSMQHCDNCGRTPSIICDSCTLCCFKDTTMETNNWIKEN